MVNPPFGGQATSEPLVVMRRGNCSVTALALLGALAVLGCSDRTRPNAEPAEEQATHYSAVDDVQTSGTAEASGRLSTEATQTENVRDDLVTPVSTPANSAPDMAEQTMVVPAIDIFEAMLEWGFELETEDDLANYLPVPPRSEGQVGRFFVDGETVSIARVTYPAELFADPHEGWIRERIDLLDQSTERVLRRGATVIHIVAESDEVADRLLEMFSATMGGGPEED